VLGDLSAKEQHPEAAARSWRQAAQLDPSLEADLLKRQLFSEYEADSPAECFGYFNKLYTLLLKQDPEEARCFLEMMILHGPQDLVASDLLIPPPQLKQARQKNPHLSVNNPALPKELRLQLFVALLSTLDTDSPSFPFGLAPPKDDGDIVDTVQLLETDLDKLYPNLEYYLRKKIHFNLDHHKQYGEGRRAIYRLLILNSRLEKEFLTRYTELAISTARAHKQIAKELLELAHFFPNRYDLLRIWPHLKGNPYSEADLIAPLSEALKKTFLLQIAVEQKKTKKMIEALIPPVQECGYDGEADRRLLTLFSDSIHLFNHKKHLSTYFKKIITSSSEASEMINTIGQGRHTAPKGIMVYCKTYQKMYPRDWRPYYTSAKVSLDDLNDPKTALRPLHKAEGLMDGSGLLDVTVTDLGSNTHVRKRIKRAKGDRKRRGNLADLSAVRISEPTEEQEARSGSDSLELAIEGPSEEEDPVVTLMGPDLENRVQGLIENKSIDPVDGEELEGLLAKVRAGDKDAISRLEDLLFYLT